MSGTGIERRTFIKTAALAGAVVAGASVLGGCAKSADASGGGKWDKEADIVIVGGGGTGFTAGIEAARAGNSVIILEKADKPGGNTGLSAGMMLAAGTDLQKQLAGVKDDSPERHLAQVLTYCEGLADDELVKTVVYGMPDAVNFMVQLGRKYTLVTDLPRVRGYDTDDNWRPRIHWSGTGASGAEHMKLLMAEAQKLGVQVLESTPVKSLVKDPSVGVTGVVADSEGEEIRVKAKKGVILASGGIDRSPELSKQYSPQQYRAQTLANLSCWPENTGDGTRMAMAADADLSPANMQACLESDVVASLGAFTWATAEKVGYAFPGNIVVDRFGKRFCQDDAQWPHLHRSVFRKLQEYGDQAKPAPAFIIADSKAAAGWFMSLAGPGKLDAAVDNKMYFKADTIEGLAKAIGVDAANLTTTVNRWNAIQATTSDPDHGRFTEWAPIRQAPFYAGRHFVTNMGTGGGVKINSQMQVLDLEGKVIPRLYAGGMVAGGWMGSFYPGCGYAVSATIVMGRLASKAASQNKAW